MATGWSIKIGYLSGYSYGGDKDEAWEELAGYVATIASNPVVLIAEAQNFRAPFECPDGCGMTLTDVAMAYALPDDEGSPLHVDAEEKVVSLIASGDRVLKEHVCRAFCRLVIHEMHRRGIEVSVTVA